jgi:long-chain acyl-CoA synthetase
LPLLQGYGQTEASPLISCNKKLTNNPATVGPPVRGVLVKISKNNEILVKGKNLMLGYWNNSSLTKKTIINGWLHTGDLGLIDEQGRIIITGRKKDLIVTSGGDNISAQRIEGYLTSYNEISQAIIFGDGKPFLISLIKMNDNYTEVDLKKIIKNLNKKLNSIEKIRKYIILDEELTYEKGFMTQTMKIKRKKVFEYFKNKINALY